MVTTRVAPRRARRSELLGDAAQQPVDEPAGVLGGVLLGELDRLADHDRGRHVGLPAELVRAEAQHRAVDRGHALERPVLGELAQQRVDVGVVLLDAAHELHRVLVGRRRLLLEEHVDAEVAHLELVTEAEGPLPSFAAASGDGHAIGPALRLAPGSPRCGCRP